MFNALRDKNEDTNPLMSKEFVILLKPSAENGGETTNEVPVEAPTSTTPDKKLKSKGKKASITDEGKAKLSCLDFFSILAASTSVTEPISVQIDSQPPLEVNVSSNGIPADPTQPKRTRKSVKKDAKRGM
jgi:hypothetical protein